MKIVIQVFVSILGVFIFGNLINLMIKQNALNQLDVKKNKTILVFGDSHAECGFYDEDNQIQNFGTRSEVPNLTLLKAKQVIENSETKKVIITFSPHNISKWHELRFFEQDSSGATLSKYWSLIDNKYILEHYNSLPFKTKALLHLKKITGAPNIESSFSVKNTFKGGFYKGKDTVIINNEEAKAANIRHFGNENFTNVNTVISSAKLKGYYRSLIEYLISKGSEVYIIGTPLHENYIDLIPKNNLKEYEGFLSKLRNEYPGIKVIDYTNLSLPDKYFLNSDHLNLQGARYFTNLVINEINK